MSSTNNFLSLSLYSGFLLGNTTDPQTTNMVKYPGWGGAVKGGGGGVTLMYQLYAAVRGMGFRAVNSGIGYRNRTVLV